MIKKSYFLSIIFFILASCLCAADSDLEKILKEKLIEQLDQIDEENWTIEKNKELPYRYAHLQFINGLAFGMFSDSKGNGFLPSFQHKTLKRDHGFLWGSNFIFNLESLGNIGNIEFLLCFGDNVFACEDLTKSVVLASCKKLDEKRKNIVLIPTIFYESPNSVEPHYKNLMDIYDKNQAEGLTFKKKVKKVLFRGVHNIPEDVNEQRVRAVFLSHEHPNLIDAKFVNLPLGKEHSLYWRKLHEIGSGKPLNYCEQSKYAYHLCLDGWAASWIKGGRLLEGFLLGNLCFNASAFELFYEPMLKPFVHYIPIKPDLSDLIEKIQWANDHPEEAEKIAENGRQFALKYLTPEKQKEYLKFVIQEIEKRQKFSKSEPDFPRIPSYFERVKLNIHTLSKKISNYFKT